MTDGLELFTANPELVLRCELEHALFSMAWSVPLLVALCLIWTTSSPAYTGRRIWRSAFVLCFALGSISHYLADTWDLGF